MHACVSGHLDLVNLLLQNREAIRHDLRNISHSFLDLPVQGQHPDLAFTPLDVNHADAGGWVPKRQITWKSWKIQIYIHSSLFVYMYIRTGRCQYGCIVSVWGQRQAIHFLFLTSTS